MIDYFIRLAILLPLIGGMAWGSLWLWRRAGHGLPLHTRPDRPARMIDVLPMGTAGKLAVVDFDGRSHLIAISRGSISLIASSTGSDFDA